MLRYVNNTDIKLPDKPCSILDPADATETAMMCVNKWKKTI